MMSSNGSPVQVSVVIVTWNVQQHVLACLHSLVERTTGVSFDVTVIDNASSDGTAEAVRRLPHVRLIANGENVGFARACNQGIRATTAPYILLLNPDCLLLNDICSLMVDHVSHHPQVGMVGPRILRPDGSDDLQSPRLIPTLWSDFCDRSGLAEHFPRSRIVAAHHMPTWDRRASGRVEAISGACMMLVRRAVDHVGLFDEDYFMFGEDVDMCLRMNKAGWQVHYLAEALIVHEGGASTGQARNVMTKHALLSRLRFFRKHRGSCYALVHRGIAALLAVVKLAVLVTTSPFIPRSRERARVQWELIHLCMGTRYEDS